MNVTWPELKASLGAPVDLPLYDVITQLGKTSILGGQGSECNEHIERNGPVYLTGSNGITVGGDGGQNTPYNVIGPHLKSTPTVSISGDGTQNAPYEFTSDGGHTYVTGGTNITVQGDGSLGNPYSVSMPYFASSDTIEITGPGTEENPVQFNVIGGTTTIINGSDTVFVNGDNINGYTLYAWDYLQGPGITITADNANQQKTIAAKLQGINGISVSYPGYGPMLIDGSGVGLQYWIEGETTNTSTWAPNNNANARISARQMIIIGDESSTFTTAGGEPNGVVIGGRSNFADGLDCAVIGGNGCHPPGMRSVTIGGKGVTTDGQCEDCALLALNSSDGLTITAATQSIIAASHAVTCNNLTATAVLGGNFLQADGAYECGMLAGYQNHLTGGVMYSVMAGGQSFTVGGSVGSHPMTADSHRVYNVFTAAGRHCSTAVSNSFMMGSYGRDHETGLEPEDSLNIAGGTEDDRRLVTKLGRSRNGMGAGISSAWHTDSVAAQSAYFELDTSLRGQSDTRGFAVSLGEDGKLTLADSWDECIGITSSRDGIIGGAQHFHWKDKYLTDDFGCLVLHSDAELVSKSSAGTVRATPVLNPGFKSEAEYVPRALRKEWTPVVYSGMAIVRDDGSCRVGKRADIANGQAFLSAGKEGRFVTRRVSKNTVEVMIC